ncbi:MAG: hypothetical protein AB7V62_10795 [Thermoleophilia bacterium]
MSSPPTEIEYEALDYDATIGKLRELAGREVIVELRIGGARGPCRLAARGVLTGHPPRQEDLTARRDDGDDIEAFMLDGGGFLAVEEAAFRGGEWHAGSDEGQFSAQPRLNVLFEDAVLHVAVNWRHDPEG